MLPTSNDVHVDSLLTNISIGYKNTGYIADQIFPIVPVTKQSDIVPKYNQSHWFRDEAQLRAPATESVGGGYSVDVTDTYFCPQYSFHKVIPDPVRANADAPFNLDREATEFVTDKLMMRREVAFATANFTTSVWGDDESGGAFGGGGDFVYWSDYANSLPLVDMLTYQDEVEGRIGIEANAAVFGKQVWNVLRWHPDLVDIIKYTQRGIVTQELFQAATGFGKVLVGRAIRTTTLE